MQRKMEELRLLCDRETSVLHQRLSTSMNIFRNSLQSIKLKAEETAENEVKLVKIKAYLRELEDDLIKAQAAKNCKEAKRMATVDSLSATKARVEDLRKKVQDERNKKDEYRAIISQQSLALATLKKIDNQETKNGGDIEEAISWYNRVLRFRIEVGHGVKFIFDKINLKNLNEELSFTIRHANGIYTLLDCDPYLDDIKELIQELNQTNCLFKFVRIMREKFQAATSKGSSTVSLSAPALSVSVDCITEPAAKENELQIQSGELERPFKKVNYGRGGKPAILSPAFASSLRRSPRF